MCPAEKIAAVLIENEYQELEVWYPALRLREAGVSTFLVGPNEGETYLSKHGYPALAELSAKEARQRPFDVVVVPGGWAPDRMRRDADMVALVREAVQSGAVIAAICHGLWLLASADVLRGKNATCFFAIRDDVVNAGAIYRDEEVVVDGKLVTSRTPEDLPAFMAEVLKQLQ